MKPATQRFPQRQPMRRVLASISNTMEIGDVTTLANPEIVEQIRIMVQGEGGETMHCRFARNLNIYLG